MNNRFQKTGSVLLAVLLVAAIFTGCGAKKDSSTKSGATADIASQNRTSMSTAAQKGSGGNQSAEVQSKAASSMNEAAKSPEAPQNSGQASAIAGQGAPSEMVSNAILSQRKIIRNASISLEVEDFDKAYANIKSMIAAFGFIQESNIGKEKIHVGSEQKLITKGTIIIRVDKDKFERTMSDVKGLGLVLNENIRSDDVTDKFFDTEAHLRLLKFEESRLEQYLLKLTDPDTIFKTESRLTEIRRQIESLTGTLKKWTDLVELSTITIDMKEKSPIPEKPGANEKSYWHKLSTGFVESFKDIITFCGDLILFFVQALPALLFLAILGFIGLKVYRKFSPKPTTNLKPAASLKPSEPDPKQDSANL